MTLTIELTPEEEARLIEQAQREGLDAAEYARRRLVADLLGSGRPMSGAEALAFWEREGVRGVFAEGPDSPVLARQLREQEEDRSTHEDAA